MTFDEPQRPTFGNPFQRPGVECAQDHLEASDRQAKALMAWQEQVIDEIREYHRNLSASWISHSVW